MSLIVPLTNSNSPINFTGIPNGLRSIYENLVKNQKNSNEPRTNAEIRNFIKLFTQHKPATAVRTLNNALLNGVYKMYPGISKRNAEILAKRNYSKEHRKEVKAAKRRYKKYSTK